MVSTAGLEPARVSPHAPQTCAYTDSATSTQVFQLFNCQISQVSLRRRCSTLFHIPLKKRYSIVFFGRVPRRHKVFLVIQLSNFQQKYIIINIFFVKDLPMKGLDLSCRRRMSRTSQDTRTGKPPLFHRNNRGEESLYQSFLV